MSKFKIAFALLAVLVVLAAPAYAANADAVAGTYLGDARNMNDVPGRAP